MNVVIDPTRKLSGPAGWSYRCECGKETHHFKSPEAAQRGWEEHNKAKHG